MPWYTRSWYSLGINTGSRVSPLRWCHFRPEQFWLSESSFNFLSFELAWIPLGADFTWLSAKQALLFALITSYIYTLMLTEVYLPAAIVFKLLSVLCNILAIFIWSVYSFLIFMDQFETLSSPSLLASRMEGHFQISVLCLKIQNGGWMSFTSSVLVLNKGNSCIKFGSTSHFLKCVFKTSSVTGEGEGWGEGLAVNSQKDSCLDTIQLVLNIMVLSVEFSFWSCLQC